MELELVFRQDGDAHVHEIRVDHHGEAGGAVHHPEHGVDLVGARDDQNDGAIIIITLVLLHSEDAQVGRVDIGLVVLRERRSAHVWQNDLHGG